MANLNYDPDNTLAGGLFAMTPREAVRLAIGLCEAVERAVGAEGSHCGVWPGNVTCADGQVAVGPVNQETKFGNMPPDLLEFISPEQFWMGKASPASDVYSIGMILYTALNRGILPFFEKAVDNSPEDRSNALQSRMRGEVLPPPSNASPEAAAVVLKSMAFQATERYATPGQLRAALCALPELAESDASPVQQASQEKRAEQPGYTVEKKPPLEGDALEEDALKREAQAEAGGSRSGKRKSRKAKKAQKRSAALASEKTEPAAAVPSDEEQESTGQPLPAEPRQDSPASAVPPEQEVPAEAETLPETGAMAEATEFVASASEQTAEAPASPADPEPQEFPEDVERTEPEGDASAASEGADLEGFDTTWFWNTELESIPEPDWLPPREQHHYAESAEVPENGGWQEEPQNYNGMSYAENVPEYRGEELPFDPEGEFSPDPPDFAETAAPPVRPVVPEPQWQEQPRRYPGQVDENMDALVFRGGGEKHRNFLAPIMLGVLVCAVVVLLLKSDLAGIPQPQETPLLEGPTISGNMIHPPVTETAEPGWELPAPTPSPSPAPTPEPSQEPEASPEPQFELVMANVSWTQARALCEERGGHLATVRNDEEFEKICELAEAQGAQFVWLGAFRDNSSTWYYVTGERADYFRWDVGEPSLQDNDGTREDYLLLWYRTNSGKWCYNDQRDDPVSLLPHTYGGRTAYVCQYD